MTNAPNHSSPGTGSDFYNLSGPDLLAYCGADASKWAQAFCRIKEVQGWGVTDIDEGLMISWFANAIEHSSQLRGHAQAAPDCGAKAYVERAIASYAGDPADNQFQKGFLAALEVVRDEAFPAREKCPHCLGSCNPLPEGSGYCEKCRGTGWASSVPSTQSRIAED